MAFGLNDLKEMAILLGLIALIGASVAIALIAFQDEIKDDLPVVTATNETVTLAASTNTRVDVNGDVLEITGVNRAFYTNLSTNNITLTANTHFNVTNGQIFMMTEAFDGNLSYWTYSYKLPSTSYNITIQGEQGISNTTDFLDTIGTIAGVVVLISFVVLAFTFGTDR